MLISTVGSVRDPSPKASKQADNNCNAVIIIDKGTRAMLRPEPPPPWFGEGTITLQTPFGWSLQRHSAPSTLLLPTLMSLPHPAL